ncbi:TPA: hypothetical protein DCZ31_03535 [Patescibacteria group bacterium]|nr:hypothetical protein [Candidatus Gracilibacteria bacterium]
MQKKKLYDIINLYLLFKHKIMAGEAPKNNIPQVPKQEVILGPIEQLIKLREDFETKQPSFANYTKQK